MMIEVFAAIALNLATTTAGLAASADESPVAPSKNGIPSLAPILNKITQAVVNIETKGRMSGPEVRGAISPRRLRCGLRCATGLIVSNDHVLDHANVITVNLEPTR